MSPFQVFINKVDAADEEMIELVEMEIRELLSEMGFDGDNLPIIKGSALCAVEDKNEEIGKATLLLVYNSCRISFLHPFRLQARRPFWS